MTVPSSPQITALRVVPVAGRDSMLMNLSGAHGPFFTRNLLILTDSAGRSGVGEVPGGEKIRQTLEDAAPLLIGQPIGAYLQLLQQLQQALVRADRLADHECRGVLQGLADLFAARHFTDAGAAGAVAQDQQVAREERAVRTAQVEQHAVAAGDRDHAQGGDDGRG